MSTMRKFRYNELRAATKRFKTLLGNGESGDVYIGQLRSKEAVAVKKLKIIGEDAQREFDSEIHMLELVSHVNLIILIGWCAHKNRRLLVYEHMSNGSLDDHLFDPNRQPIQWGTRLKIALGAARGLDHLHCQYPPIIHRDITSSNILLDRDFNPKLCDFGLAKFGPVGPNTHVSTKVRGTSGYVAPEYDMTRHLTLESDVYSFGVVLLELITGRRAIFETEDHGQQLLVDWSQPVLTDSSKFTDFLDCRLNNQFLTRDQHISLQNLVTVAAYCVRIQAQGRPRIGEIVMGLNKIHSEWNKGFLN